MAGTEHCAREYSSFLPGKYVHVGFREDILESYWAHCNTLRTQGKEPPPTLLICDDILVTRSSKKHGVTRTSDNFWLNRVYAEGRHQNMSVILSVQSMSIGLPFVRCADLFVTFPSSLFAYQDVKMVCENYVPIGNRKLAESLLDEFTQYEALVVEYWRQSSRRWKERVRWYTVSGNFATCSINVGRVPRIREGDQRRHGGNRHPTEACADVPGSLHRTKHKTTEGEATRPCSWRSTAEEHGLKRSRNSTGRQTTEAPSFSRWYLKRKLRI